MKFSSLILFLTLFAAFFSTDSTAQIPSGASFWLRADSGIIFSQNNVVAEWKDRSGTSKSAFQSLPVSQPTLLPMAFNNMPALHFDGRFDYMDCAPVFPVAKDYTITIVARVIDFTRSNHLISGNTHAIYSGTTGFSVIQNDTLPAPSLISKIALLPNQPSIITVSYQQSSQTASIYINGEFADSAVIGPNKDPKIYLGAFQGIAAFYGDLAEIVLYSRVLTEADRKQLEDYLFTKYAIPPAPAPDSIYTAIPKNLQFYARESDDSVTVPIAGNIFEAGYDSIYIKVFTDGIFTARLAQALHYEAGKASFSFSPRIHAQLSEYSFVLAEKSAAVDKQIGRRDSIVCGDVLLISGQSNAINNNLGYTNEFFRTFGSNQASTTADTAWAISNTAVSFGPGPISGSWGVRLQENIMNTYKIPTCVINGGVGGTAIALHLPDPSNRQNISTIYGNMLYRVQKANLAEKAKMIFWYQGESDILQGYADKFRALDNAWMQDYPNVRKIYVMQVRPGCTLGFGADVRDLLRTLQDSFPIIESVSTMGLPGHDGCHFLPEGYSQLGDQLFRLVARDFYGSKDNDQIRSPNILQAYYANSSQTRIGLTFSPSETRFTIPNDTTVGGIPASIKDYFYLNDSGEVVRSISTSGNRIFLDLNQASSSRTISYLPDKYYNHTSAVYEGPWIENSRGVGAFSFYRFPIVDSAQVGVPEYSDGSAFSFKVYPNPSNGKFIAQYTLAQTQDVTITISDLMGRELVARKMHSLTEGRHEEIFDMNSMPVVNGMYICKLQAGTKIRMTTLLVQP